MATLKTIDVNKEFKDAFGLAAAVQPDILSKDEAIKRATEFATVIVSAKIQAQAIQNAAFIISDAMRG